MGKGVEENHDKALLWLTKSVEQGYAFAQLNMGLCYYLGIIVEKDYLKAVEYLETTRKNETDKTISGQAAFMLSKCYRNGRGVPQDTQKADELLKESQEKGCNEAKSIDDLLKKLQQL